MAVLSSSSQRPSITPPVQCSSRNSMAESSRESSGRKAAVTPADSMEYINRLVKDDLKPKSSIHGKKMKKTQMYHFMI